MRDIHGRVVQPFPSASQVVIESSTAVNDDEDDDMDLDTDRLPEEKFRVDRKKLEQMLLGYNVDVAETAENFFQRIMNETNTVITWPSKLKIGAKSKKDPHIKVCGLQEDIQLAKSKIYAVLDMKSSKVTLKMDVSYTDHSHVIGRRGISIQEVMKDTGCHIHFPDSNRSNPIEKSNQVSIAGQPRFVEMARSRIRGMLPLNFTFEIPITSGFQPLPDPLSGTIQAVENNYEVKVQFKRNPKTCCTFVLVRGSETNARRVMEATFVLLDHLTGALNRGGVSVRTTLEVGPQHHAKVKEQIETERIAQKTGTTIVFPDSNRLEFSSVNKSTITISGGIEGVYMARLYLMGCLPLFLLFELKDDQVIKDVSHLMNQLNVSISVKPKPKMSTICIIIRGVEREASHLYDARRILLGVDDDEPLAVGGNIFYTVAQTDFSQNCISLNNNVPRGILGPNFLTVNTANAMSFQSQMVASSGLPTSTANSGGGGHVTGWSHGSYSQRPQIVLPSIINQDSAIRYGTVKPYVRNTNPPSLMTTASLSSLSAPSSTTSSLSSPSESPPRGSPIGTALNHHGCSSETFLELVRRNDEILQAQNATLGMLHAGAFTNLNSVDRHSSFSPRSNTSDSETIIPHKDKSLTQDSVNSTPKNSTTQPDYDTKRIQAASAMKLKLDGPEVRVPTSLWSGYGFSHSMSAAAFRELKERTESSAFDLSGNLTLQAVEFDKDPWKDSSMTDGANNLCALTAGLSTDDHLSTPVAAAAGDAGFQQRKRCADAGLGSSNYIDSASLPKLSPALVKCTDLTDLFRILGLSKYSTLFRHQEIDLETFGTLSDQDLKDLGITTFGARRKMLLAISDLKKEQPTVFSAAPGAERKLGTTKKNGSPDDSSKSYWR